MVADEPLEAATVDVDTAEPVAGSDSESSEPSKQHLTQCVWDVRGLQLQPVPHSNLEFMPLIHPVRAAPTLHL